MKSSIQCYCAILSPLDHVAIHRHPGTVCFPLHRIARHISPISIVAELSSFLPSFFAFASHVAIPYRISSRCPCPSSYASALYARIPTPASSVCTSASRSYILLHRARRTNGPWHIPFIRSAASHVMLLQACTSKTTAIMHSLEPPYKMQTCR